MVAKAVRKEQEHTRAELSLQVTNDVVANVPPYVDAFLRNYMNNHILHVHLTESLKESGWKGKKVKADIASMVAKAVRKEQE
ncbi:hypothetical protein Tco_0470372, partial [Tanacetum coccineum]